MKKTFIFSLILLSMLSFKQLIGWETVQEVIQPTPENFTEGSPNNAGNNGQCVKYTYQEFKLFGMTIGHRTTQEIGLCQTFYGG